MFQVVAHEEEGEPFEKRRHSWFGKREIRSHNQIPDTGMLNSLQNESWKKKGFYLQCLIAELKQKIEKTKPRKSGRINENN